MIDWVGPPRPLRREEEAVLRRLWHERALSVGRVVETGARRFRILGFDPVSVRPRLVYVEELGTGAPHALEVEETG